MTKRETARAYRRLHRELLKLQVPGSPHISGRDGKRAFDMAQECKQIASRIEAEYPSSDY